MRHDDFVITQWSKYVSGTGKTLYTRERLYNVERVFLFRLVDDHRRILAVGICSNKSLAPFREYKESLHCTKIQYYNEGIRRWETLIDDGVVKPARVNKNDVLRSTKEVLTKADLKKVKCIYTEDLEAIRNDKPRNAGNTNEIFKFAINHNVRIGKNGDPYIYQGSRPIFRIKTEETQRKTKIKLEAI